MKLCYYCNQKNNDQATHCKICHVDLATSRGMRIFRNFVVWVLPILAVILLITTFVLWTKMEVTTKEIIFTLLSYVMVAFFQLYFRSAKMKAIAIEVNPFRKSFTILPEEMLLLTIVTGVLNIMALCMNALDTIIIFTQIS